MAKSKFKIDNQWHTWIDYDKFHDLIASEKEFSSMDYIAPTPSWAIFGDSNKGFDPSEVRFRRKQKVGVQADQ